MYCNACSTVYCRHTLCCTVLCCPENVLGCNYVVCLCGTCLVQNSQALHWTLGFGTVVYCTLQSLYDAVADISTIGTWGKQD